MSWSNIRSCKPIGCILFHFSRIFRGLSKAYRLVKLSERTDVFMWAGGRPASLTICVKVSFSSNNFFISQPIYFILTHIVAYQDLFTNMQHYLKKQFNFNVRLLSVLLGHLVFSSPPKRPMTSDFEGFSIPDLIHHIYFIYLNSWDRASIFPFECSVLNKGTTGTIVITSLVWRGSWLGIEPGTSRTRSQHYTTRLSRRRY